MTFRVMSNMYLLQHDYRTAVMMSEPVQFGQVIVIRRDGEDGPAFPLTASECLFGRYSWQISCHIITVVYQYSGS